MENRLLTRLRAGEACGALWLEAGSPALAELCANQRPDALCFDMQHGQWDAATLHAAIGMTRHETVPLVRVAENTPEAIGRALDLGALGVIVPLVETAEEARAAVAAAKYPPEGRRSAGGLRPFADFPAYVAASSRQLLTAVMIETRRGVENAEAIARTPGLDMVFIGTGDLALSLGTFPETGPEHEAAMAKVLDACCAAGIVAGTFATHTSFAVERRRQGFGFVIIGIDTDWLRKGAGSAVRGFAAPPVPAFDPERAVALVTGSNRGIGRAIVAALAEAGVKRIYAGHRAGRAAPTGPDIVPVELDITDPQMVAAAAQRCTDATLLVNNAGINFNAALLAPAEADFARQEVETNYLGTLATCRAFAPVIARNGGGTIVNLLSILGRVSLPAMGSLCASKAAALLMTQGLRAELAGRGIRVIGVMPGAVDTEMTRHLSIPKLAPAEVAAAILDALRRGAEDLYPGAMAAEIAAGLALDAKTVERRFAAYLPQGAA